MSNQPLKPDQLELYVQEYSKRTGVSVEKLRREVNEARNSYKLQIAEKSMRCSCSADEHRLGMFELLGRRGK